MSDVFTVAVSAGASLLAAVLALAGSAIVRAIDRGHEQARRDAEALGPVLAYLDDTQPDRQAVNVPGEVDAASVRLTELTTRWRSVREPLYLLKVSHPDMEVRAGARKLIADLGNVHHWLGWFVADMVKGRDFQESLKQLRTAHQGATECAEDLSRRMAP